MADYIAALKRRRLAMALVGIPIALTALLLAFALPDVYRSTALIEVEEASISGYMVEGTNRQSYVDQYVSSLGERVMRVDNIDAWIEKHGLYPQYEEDRATARRQLRRDVEVTMVRAPVLDPSSGREREIITAFTVGYNSHDPALARAVADDLSEAYLEANRQNRRLRVAGAAQFYGAEAERLREEVQSLETQLAAFQEQNIGRLPDLQQVNMNALDRTERELENAQGQIRTLQRERVFLAQQLAQAQLAHPDAGRLRELEDEYRRRSAVYDESHPDLIAMRRQIESVRQGRAGGQSLEQQIESQRQVLEEARQRYSDDHPDIRRLIRNIGSLEARRDAGESVDETQSPEVVQLETQLNALDTQVAGLQEREGELHRRMEQLETRVAGSPQVEREYRNLTRDLATAREKYQEVISRRMDAELSEAAISAGQGEEFRLVQRAGTPSEPAKPAREAIGVIGLMMSLVLALSTAVGTEALDRTVRGSRDLRTILNVPPLAVVPEVRNSVSRRRQLIRGLLMAVSFVVVAGLLYYAIQAWI